MLELSKSNLRDNCNLSKVSKMTKKNNCSKLAKNDLPFSHPSSKMCKVNSTNIAWYAAAWNARNSKEWKLCLLILLMLVYIHTKFDGCDTCLQDFRQAVLCIGRDFESLRGWHTTQYRSFDGYSRQTAKPPKSGHRK